jgi:hypothetical protein
MLISNFKTKFMENITITKYIMLVSKFNVNMVLPNLYVTRNSKSVLQYLVESVDPFGNRKIDLAAFVKISDN